MPARRTIFSFMFFCRFCSEKNAPTSVPESTGVPPSPRAPSCPAVGGRVEATMTRRCAVDLARWRSGRWCMIATRTGISPPDSDAGEALISPLVVSGIIQRPRPMNRFEAFEGRREQHTRGSQSVHRTKAKTTCGKPKITSFPVTPQPSLVSAVLSVGAM
jgi:hypothetical protein